MLSGDHSHAKLLTKARFYFWLRRDEERVCLRNLKQVCKAVITVCNTVSQQLRWIHPNIAGRAHKGRCKFTVWCTLRVVYQLGDFHMFLRFSKKSLKNRCKQGKPGYCTLMEKKHTMRIVTKLGPQLPKLILTVSYWIPFSGFYCNCWQPQPYFCFLCQ